MTSLTCEIPMQQQYLDDVVKSGHGGFVHSCSPPSPRDRDPQELLSGPKKYSVIYDCKSL